MFVMFPRTDGSLANCSEGIGLNPSQLLNASATPIPGYLAQEVVASLYPATFFENDTTWTREDGGLCANKFLLSWMRIAPTDRNGSLSATHMYCVPSWQSATFDVTVDSDGYVLEANRIGDFDEMDDVTKNKTQTVVTEMNEHLGTGVAIAPSFMQGVGLDQPWHNDTLTLDWMNYLLRLKLNSSRLLDAAQPVPEFDSVKGPVEALYKTLVANMIGARLSTLFEASTQPTEILGMEMGLETRIFMDRMAFIATIAILGLMVIVATALYVRERRPFLPRLPSTIGSLLAYVAASRAVRGYEEPRRGFRGGRGQKRCVEKYSYGRYTGVDGAEHVGIELDPFVKSMDDGKANRPKGSMRFRR